MRRSPYYKSGQVTLLHGDVREQLRTLADESVQCVVTSPPYWGLRDYGVTGQLGLEPTPEEFVAAMVEVFCEVHRVLAKDGTLWLNIGDSYAGSWGAQGREGSMASRSGISARQIGEHPQFATRTGARGLGNGIKPKDIVGIPWMLAFALRADGWYLRQEIIWHKPNPMPESVTDRCTKAHESLFLLAKSPRYFYDADAIREQASQNTHGGLEPNQHKRWAIGMASQKSTLGVYSERETKRSVWSIPTAPFPGAHFATFPPALVEPCVLAGSRPGDLVLDPFVGSGTTAMVARDLGRRAIGIDLNTEYLVIAARRVGGQLHMEMS